MICCNRTGAESPQRTRKKGEAKRKGGAHSKAKHPEDDAIRQDLERLQAAGIQRAPRPVLVGGNRVGGKGRFDSIATLPAERNQPPGTLGIAPKDSGVPPPPGWRNTSSTSTTQHPIRHSRDSSVTFKPGTSPTPSGKENEGVSDALAGLGSPNNNHQPSLPHRVPLTGSITSIPTTEEHSRGSDTPKVKGSRGSSSITDDPYSDTEEAAAQGGGSASSSLSGLWNSYDQQELEYDGPLEPVIINVYNLIDPDPNNKLAKVGLGLYHSGVELYGMEWSYGEAVEETQVSGIFHVAPRTCMNSIKASVIVGCTKLNPEQVDTILRRLETEWKSVDYHVCNHNCNHFASHFLELLSLGLDEPITVPPWVNRIASGLDYVVPKRLATWFVRKIDGNPPVAVVDPRQGVKISSLPTSIVPRDWYRARHLAREPKYALRLDGRFVELPQPSVPSAGPPPPAATYAPHIAVSVVSSVSSPLTTPSLPLGSLSTRFALSPDSPLTHGGKEPPSPATLARATFSPPSTSPSRGVRVKGHFDPMAEANASPLRSTEPQPTGDDDDEDGNFSPAFPRSESASQPLSPVASERQPEADARRNSASNRPGHLDRATLLEVEAAADATESNSGDTLPNFASSFRAVEASQSNPTQTPTNVGLEIGLTVNRNSRHRVSSVSHGSHGTHHTFTLDAPSISTAPPATDDMDSPSAVPRSQAQSYSEVTNGSHAAYPPSPSVVRSSTTVARVAAAPDDDTNVSATHLRLSALGGMVDLGGSFTFSSSQRMSVPPPKSTSVSAKVVEDNPSDTASIHGHEDTVEIREDEMLNLED